MMRRSRETFPGSREIEHACNREATILSRIPYSLIPMTNRLLLLFFVFLLALSACARQQLQPTISLEDFREKAAASQPARHAAAVQEVRERQDRIERINSSLEISTLIKRYSTLYSDRNLIPFLELFAEQARENGMPLTEQTAKYRSLFARARAIDLTIGDLTWNQSRSGFQASGPFNAAYTYTDGNSSKHQGRISFNLIREQGDLKIKSLDYTFE